MAAVHAAALAAAGGEAAAEAHAAATYEDVVYVHFAFGLASLVGATAVYCVWAGLPRGKLDPASRIIHMITIWDLLYSLKFTVTAVAFLAGATNPRASFHLIDDNCLTSAMADTFFGLQTVIWNACYVFDLVAVLRNPLRTTRGN